MAADRAAGGVSGAAAEGVLGSLNKASPDKGGHRVNAIDLTRTAIEEVKTGIRVDNNH